MIIRGVDVSKLGNQFHGMKQGRVLILDADGPAYRVAATTKTLPTAIRRFQQNMLAELFTTQSSTGILHLTHETSKKSGRFDIIGAKPYQGQRKGGVKPALLNAVRGAVSLESNWVEEYEVIMHYRYEADDGMMMDAYRLKEDGLIWSDDKDLRMTPYKYWNKKTGAIFDSDPFGHLYIEETDSGKKCYGHSLKFFWAQMLMGDTADNIQGILKLGDKKCGAVGAYECLNPLKTIEEVANTVLDAYRLINQNPLPEGYLLWMLRWEGDCFWNYLNELPISNVNRMYLNECVTRQWFLPSEAERDVPF